MRVFKGKVTFLEIRLFASTNVANYSEASFLGAERPLLLVLSVRSSVCMHGRIAEVTVSLLSVYRSEHMLERNLVILIGGRRCNRKDEIINGLSPSVNLCFASI